jgi:uncharacterized protein DUF6232
MSPQWGATRVVINGRTLQIGYQTFTVASITRVDAIVVPPSMRVHAGIFGRSCLLAIAAYFGLGVVVVVPLAATNSASLVTNVSMMVALAAAGSWFFIYRHTKNSSRPQYALVLYTANGPVNALLSHDFAEIHRIKLEIEARLEYPPPEDVTIHAPHTTVYNNYNYGSQWYEYNQYNQYGDGSVGRNENR